MAKPVIFTIDDDTSVLNSIERDLRAHYGQDYRILPINEGRAALDYLKKLEQRNETVALFLVDQRMPEMSGTEFLTEATKTHPQAKRVLLTAYADTQAAIDSINEVRLDYYLMKPWHPPDERLYPILDELLEDCRSQAIRPRISSRVIKSPINGWISKKIPMHAKWLKESHRTQNSLSYFFRMARY
jgi:thioredoxin reductase (NADPH)